MENTRGNSCDIDDWRWSSTDKTDECVVSDDGHEVLFHPECSGGTDCIRANRPLPRNGNHYYWEVTIYHRIYGTAVMVGVCTRNQSLADDKYYSLIGFDENGWCLTHKGDIWHNRKSRRYTDAFGEDKGDQTIGVLYDSANGILTFYKNGKCLGQAFDNLHKSGEDLYPVIGSTALRTKIRLEGAYRYFPNLKDRCRYVVYHRILKDTNDTSKLQLPTTLLQYIYELSPGSVKNDERGQNQHYKTFGQNGSENKRNHRAGVDAITNRIRFSYS